MNEEKEPSILLRLFLIYLGAVGTSTGLSQYATISKPEFDTYKANIEYRIGKLDSNCEKVTALIHQVVSNNPPKEWRDRIRALEREIYIHEGKK